ncbi:alpha/beta hydrolase [Streptomyces yaizuensis]|uniref:Serine peptidase n=1 Tax=Streptomyces yaizuensis TaxID=2989713 RepID=A0ABQ5NY26_9ACTN|nr:alpha/beta hydrolase [Streptomyces sp. YSPA8]GLF95246.1 serine peptidase [Streptomyces sp. YSPA8]
MAPIVLVHGIFNYLAGVEPQVAAARHVARCRPRLVESLARFPVDEPEVVMAYYADLLRRDTPAWSQSPGGGENFTSMTAGQRRDAAEWLVTAGYCGPGDPQGRPTEFLRTWLDQLVGARGGRLSRIAQEQVVNRLERVIVASLREADAYTAWPGRRELVQERVAGVIRREAPAVVIAHSLGSYITYETLHAHPDLEVELLVTVGSPLRVPSLARRLDPPLRAGRGARPLGLGRWVNIADVGDLVAVPPKLGEVFPVDADETCDNGIDFHSLGAYLGNGLLAAAITPYIS